MERGVRKGGTPKRPPKMLYHSVSDQSCPEPEFFVRSFPEMRGCGILTNMPLGGSPELFLYVTDIKILMPAPPHFAFSASSFVTSAALTSNLLKRKTSLSFGSTPVVCMAFVSHTGPHSCSISGLKGNSIPQNSPGTTLSTTSASFRGLATATWIGIVFKLSSGRLQCLSTGAAAPLSVWILPFDACAAFSTGSESSNSSKSNAPPPLTCSTCGAAAATAAGAGEGAAGSFPVGCPAAAAGAEGAAAAGAAQGTEATATAGREASCAASKSSSSSKSMNMACAGRAGRPACAPKPAPEDALLGSRWRA
mmetsp:Transcript_170208/g.545871  ORF Transcript_170208/g.545871 Transcript_170208/m.545871 type:complete len:308 (+) Transcript_170208:1176-2099(+)